MFTTYDKLVKRYGGEFIDKLGTRRDFNATANTYVADTSAARILEVVNCAIADACAIMKYHLSCCYLMQDIQDQIDNGENFGILELHANALTIEILKKGGDCTGCECEKTFIDFCKCNKLCTDTGICLSKTEDSVILCVEETAPCAVIWCDICRASSCCCGSN